jgi:hypothetical protein
MPKNEFLFAIALKVEVKLGDTHCRSCRVARFGIGSFEGPRLRGIVLPGGAGWILMRRDDVLAIDVPLTLETDDKQRIYMSWKGFRHGPKEVIDHLNRGEHLGTLEFYTTPNFETGSEKYSWVNRICSVRHRFAHGEKAGCACLIGLLEGEVDCMSPLP